ncbi:MAG: N utilization substance protein A [archaeon GW2011_AR17]|nr:MAG: N utilization substance protein A [archaeon GW2011_AR17]
MQSIGLINLFEKSTGAKVKDFFIEDETLVFVVHPKELRKALEKGGEKIKRFSFSAKKRVRVIEFNENIEKFVMNLLYPLRPETELKEGILFIKGKDAKEKGQIYGREKTNLKRIQGIIHKYFKVEVKVI